MMNNESINNTEVVMFDLDGTLYYGTKRIPGANEVISFFRKRGIRVFFTTNNSTKTRKQIFEKLIKMGIDVQLEEVLTSGYIAAKYFIKHKLKDIFIFGSVNLISEFKELGINVNQNDNAENLLIGYDPHMTYEELAKAVRVAIHANKLIACNKERTFPGENELLMPGCGAMTAPIEWCANKKCDVIIGKPNTMMGEYLINRYRIDKTRLLVIGDTYESDIEMAKRLGCMSICITSMNYTDTFCVNSIREVTELFERGKYE